MCNKKKKIYSPSDEFAERAKLRRVKMSIKFMPIINQCKMIALRLDDMTVKMQQFYSVRRTKYLLVPVAKT